MNKLYETIYIGYLIGYYFRDPVLLCVSNEKYKVKTYLKEVRKLSKSQYEIREVILDEESVFSLYEDYLLEEFTERILYLTNRDIVSLNEEIEETIHGMEGTYEDLKHYYQMIEKVPKLKGSLSNLSLAIQTMESHLSKVKTLRRIGHAIIEESPVVSPNILEYLQHMDYLQEAKELTELFYRKVNDND